MFRLPIARFHWQFFMESFNFSKMIFATFVNEIVHLIAVEIFEGTLFFNPVGRVAREIRVDLRANYSSLFVAGAFQSRARRERVRTRPKPRSGNCNVSGRPSSRLCARGKVIKAFVFPVHCRSNFVALQRSPRSSRNFESCSSPWEGNSFFHVRFFHIFFSSNALQKLLF